MTKLSFVSHVLILGSLAAGCGGSDDNGDSEGAANTADSGSGGASTSAGSTGSGTTSGTSNTNSASGGGTSSTSNTTSGSTNDSTSGTTSSTTGGSVNVPGDTPLSEIDTDAEAEAVCEQLASEIGPIDSEAVVEGSCAFAGLIGELLGGGDCETLQQECIADDSEDPMEMAEGCTADDIPDCDVTVDEYTACTSARVKVAFDYFAQVTCESDLENLGEEPAEPAECAGLVERCPELATDE